jgi:hypothetical protein
MRISRTRLTSGPSAHSIVRPALSSRAAPGSRSPRLPGVVSLQRCTHDAWKLLPWQASSNSWPPSRAGADTTRQMTASEGSELTLPTQRRQRRIPGPMTGPPLEADLRRSRRANRSRRLRSFTRANRRQRQVRSRTTAFESHVLALPTPMQSFALRPVADLRRSRFQASKLTVCCRSYALIAVSAPGARVDIRHAR